jgi:hypothetical protein
MDTLYALRPADLVDHCVVDTVAQATGARNPAVSGM